MSDKRRPDPSRALDRLIDARRQAPASGPGDAHDEIEHLADMATALAALASAGPGPDLDALWPTLELRIAQTPQRRFSLWPSLRLPRITQQ